MNIKVTVIGLCVSVLFFSGVNPGAQRSALVMKPQVSAQVASLPQLHCDDPIIVPPRI